MASRVASERYEADDSGESTMRDNRTSSDEAVGAIADKVGLLVNALQDTSSNLRSVDKLLDTYRTLNDHQNDRADSARGNLRNSSIHRSSNSLNDETASGRHRASTKKTGDEYSAKGTNSPPNHSRLSVNDARNSAGYTSHESSPITTSNGRHSSLGGQRNHSTPRIVISESDYEPSRPHVDNNMKADDSVLHSVHQVLRELASEQTRIRHDLDSEIRSRRSAQSASEMNLRDITDRFRRDEATDSDGESATFNASMLERQLTEIANELRAVRAKRSSSSRNVNHGQPIVSPALKSAVEAHRATPVDGGLFQAPPGSIAAQHALPTPQPHASNGHAHAHPNATTESSNEGYLKSKVSQLERQKIEHEHELEGLKRKATHAENGRLALQKQLDELQSQLHNSERDRARVRLELEDLRTEADRKLLKLTKEHDEQREEARHKAERELTLLRQRIEQLTSSSANELNEARREQDRLEFARKHAVDQIAALRSEAETRERSLAKQNAEHSERESRYGTLERQVGELQARLAATSEELRLSREANSKLTDRLHVAEHSHTEKLRNESEARQKTQDRVKQLKAQLVKAEKDYEDMRRRGIEMARKCEGATAENEQLRRQVAHIHVTFEQLKREFDNLLTIRSKQEEAIRVKDEEIDRLRSERSEFDASVEIARRDQERAKQQTQALELEVSTQRTEHARSLEQITAMETMRRVHEEQLKAYQVDIKQAHVERAQLLSANQQLATACNDLRAELSELATREKTARADLASLSVALEEEKVKHSAALLSLSRQLADVKTEERQSADSTKSLIEQEGKLQQELSSMQLELDDAQKQNRALQTRCEQQQAELLDLHARCIQAEQAEQEAQLKCRKLKDRNADQVERSLRDRAATAERERSLLMETVTMDVDCLLGRITSRPLLSSLNSGVSGKQGGEMGAQIDLTVWLADVKTKLNQVLSEFERLKDKKDGKTRRERVQTQLSDEETGYVSASPRHSASLSTTVNDQLSSLSTLSSEAAANADSRRKLEAIENELSTLLRNLDDQPLKARFPVAAAEPKGNRLNSGSTVATGRVLPDDEPPRQMTMEKENLVMRCGRLQHSLRALRDGFAAASTRAMAMDGASYAGERKSLLSNASHRVFTSVN